MAVFKAELFSIDQVLHFYESAEGENFKIFARMNPTDAYCRYSFTGSKDEGISELNNALLQIKNNADNFNEKSLAVSVEIGKMKYNLGYKL